MSDMIDLTVIPYYLLNLGVLFVLLRLLLYKPISKFLAARRERIATQLSDAEKTRVDALQLLESAQIQLKQNRYQADQVLADARVQAQAYAAEILADAKQQAAVLLAKAREQTVREAQEANDQLQAQVVDLAADLAGRILAREVRAEDHIALVDAFFDEVDTCAAS